MEPFSPLQPRKKHTYRVKMQAGIPFVSPPSAPCQGDRCGSPVVSFAPYSSKGFSGFSPPGPVAAIHAVAATGSNTAALSLTGPARKARRDPCVPRCCEPVAKAIQALHGRMVADQMLDCPDALLRRPPQKVPFDAEPRPGRFAQRDARNSPDARERKTW